MANYNYWPRYGAENYSFTMPLEDGFNPKESTEWMQVRCYSLSIHYLFFIYSFPGEYSRPHSISDDEIFHDHLLTKITF